MLCPLDCRPCRDRRCSADSCRLTGEPMMEICLACGEVVQGAAGCGRCGGRLSGWRLSRPRTLH